MTGCVLLVLLFYNSAFFAENIPGSKYPHYAEYKKKAVMFWPGFNPANKALQNGLLDWNYNRMEKLIY